MWMNCLGFFPTDSRAEWCLQYSLTLREALRMNVIYLKLAIRYNFCQDHIEIDAPTMTEQVKDHLYFPPTLLDCETSCKIELPMKNFYFTCEVRSI